MNLPFVHFPGMHSGTGYGRRPGLRFFLLLAVVLFVFVVAAKSAGSGNEAARMSANNAPAMEDAIYSMAVQLPGGSGLPAMTAALMEEMNERGELRQGQALHGFCPFRSQHLSAG